MDYYYDNRILIYGTIENLSVFKTNFDLGWENVFYKKLIAKSEGVTKFLNEQDNIVISQRFDFQKSINFFDKSDIHRIDESEKLCLYFGTTAPGTVTLRFYQLLAALYPNLRFEIDIQFFDCFDNEEFSFENGKIVKHTHDYIDDSAPVINNKFKMQHIRKDVINNTIQVVAEVIDEIEESVDAPEKEVLPSTTDDFGLDNDDFLKELGKLKHGHYKVVRCS